MIDGNYSCETHCDDHDTVPRTIAPVTTGRPTRDRGVPRRIQRNDLLLRSGASMIPTPNAFAKLESPVAKSSLRNRFRANRGLVLYQTFTKQTDNTVHLRAMDP